MKYLGKGRGRGEGGDGGSEGGERARQTPCSAFRHLLQRRDVVNRCSEFAGEGWHDSEWQSCRVSQGWNWDTSSWPSGSGEIGFIWSSIHSSLASFLLQPPSGPCRNEKETSRRGMLVKERRGRWLTDYSFYGRPVNCVGYILIFFIIFF